MTQMSSSDMVGQIQSCNEKIKELTGKTPTLFRAPYGDYNNDVVKSVNGCNMYCVQWDVDSLDWKDPTPEQIKQNIMKKIRNGSIILMHNGAKNTPEALPTVIEQSSPRATKSFRFRKFCSKANTTQMLTAKCAVKPPHNRVRK